MSTTKPDKAIAAKIIAEFTSGCRVVMVTVCLFALVFGLILYFQHTESNQRLQAFNNHFAPLPEVQEIYNLSTLYAKWPIYNLKTDLSWSRIGRDAPPDSLLELTPNLLLKSVERQRTLESHVGTLESEVETLKHLLGYVAYGFAFMFLLICALFKRTSRSN